MDKYMGIPTGVSGSSSEIDNILAKATRVLGSIESPDFSRVKIDLQRYSRLIMDLSEAFWIRDVSDINSDISSVLALRPAQVGSLEEYVVYISNVGEFFFAMAMGQNTFSMDRILDKLTDILINNGLEGLSREILSTPVRAMTFYTDQPRLFNVLFSDIDLLPWESASPD